MYSNPELSISGKDQKYILLQLTKSLRKDDFQSACLWSVEMHISGWIQKWWLCVVSYCANYIHVSNPKIGKFLWKIYNDYPQLLGTYRNTNSTEIRQCIAFVVGVCSFSKKDVLLTIPKKGNVTGNDVRDILSSVQNLDIDQNLKRIIMNGDSPIVIKLFTKLSHSIRSGNYNSSLKILSVCLYLEKHKSYKKNMQCASRTWKGLDKKHWNSWIFLLWDLLSIISEGNTDIHSIVCSWRGLYIINVNYSKFNNILPYIINTICLLTNSVNTNIQCINNEDMINKGCGNIDMIYSNILKQSSLFHQNQ
tara:strand:- start:14393 stop:15313 length:921 start_codon:yes stop_codon:yes gene_type:complete